MVYAIPHMIIVTGTVAWDYIMEFPGKFGDHILPEKIHNVNLSFIVNKFAKRRGGTGGNVSYSMGLLKTPHILFACAGADFADYKKDFKKIGIDTSHIAIYPHDHTATGFAMTDASQNQIWGYYYGAAEKSTQLQLAEISGKKQLVYIGPQGARGSMSFVRQCVALKIPYVFDPGFILTQVTDSDLVRGLQYAEYIIGNEYEIDLMEKRVSSFANIVRKKTLITTLGEKGTHILDKGKLVHIPVVKVKKVASTTGAGDAWRAGFLAGLERGLELATAGNLGAVAASFAVEYFGTQEHTYSIKAFRERYRQQFGSLVKL